jgi:hypothetical protein
MVTRRVIEVSHFQIRTSDVFDALRDPPHSSIPQSSPRKTKKNASSPLKSVPQTNGHVFHFIRLQTAIPGSRCVSSPARIETLSYLLNPTSSPPHCFGHSLSLSLVDSEMCETAVSQKIDLLARMESVLVGSVKISESSSIRLQPKKHFG